MVESINLVQERFSKILEAADFVGSTEGVTLLDAISMRLQVIGELVKKIQKADPIYLSGYAEIDWKKIAKFRELGQFHRADMVFSRKYGMDFRQFMGQRVVEKKEYCWEVETDAMDWETAISGIQTIELKDVQNANTVFSRGA